MNANDPNVVMVEIVAAALAQIREPLVYLGGCATGLLITDQGRPPVRATKDVDLIAEVVSHAAYYKLHEELKGAGFVEDPDVTCRWRLGNQKVDVMPTDEGILGHTNRWYPQAIRSAAEIELPSGRKIQVVTPPLFIATKLEAFYGRGKDDYSSHDIEDIVVLVDGRPELVDEIRHGDPEVSKYAREEFEDLLANPEFLERLPWHFGTDNSSQDRVPIVISRLREIAGL